MNLSSEGDGMPFSATSNASVFSRLESNAQPRGRSVSAIFQKAKGVYLYDECGTAYLDFFAGAGALNHGHNPDAIKQRLIDYLSNDGITHGLDIYTAAKQELIETFNRLILAPKNLRYKMQFCGPTGSHAVSAALALSRKITGRNTVFAFMGGFHGLSQGTPASVPNRSSRAPNELALQDVTFMPFPAADSSANFDTLAYLRMVLNDSHSGVEMPAAIIVEPLQADGGINILPSAWLQGLRRLCDEHRILLIADERHIGCGRTGPFFAFERAGIVPDLVVLSKAINGYDLPMSLVLIKPELDAWSAGATYGTFRGHPLAFVAATAALEQFVEQDFAANTLCRENEIRTFCAKEIKPLHPAIDVRGTGLIWGIDVAGAGGAQYARQVTQRCFERKLIIERAGRHDCVLTMMPPLTITPDQLQHGLAILRDALRGCMPQSLHNEAAPKRAPRRGSDAAHLREVSKTQ